MAQGNVTRIKNILNEADVDRTELTPAQVKVYIKKVETSYTEYHQYHQQIMASVPLNKREEQDVKFLNFETLHEQVSTILETWLGNLTAPPRVQEQQAIPLAVNQQPIVIQQSLPRAIPTFDGRYESWKKFKIMFRDAVDRTNEAPRIKLYHLEKALVGDAAGLIDVKTISDGNYDHAWQLLNERFEDKRRMIDIHIAGLLGVTKLSKVDFSELRALVETISGHVENLKFLNQEFTGISEPIVVHLIARVLDTTTKKLWESTIRRVRVDPVEELMQKFWEVESVSPETVPSCEEEQCEAHFAATYRRDDSGRYIVQLPLKDIASQLSNSRSMALRRFYMLESKLQHHPDLKAQYDAFLDEYEELGHCREVKECDDPPGLQTWTQRRKHFESPQFIQVVLALSLDVD
ncbi:uncharacterized protein LOC135714322 [Ochlerotatus camptorhynchus]|uniref:uncharacterized protein LOC135714322 n=1 Tax=Ochlerotatus camptorhynchus TaxID=644619 RepID=UPI0031CDBAE4